jgi:hypothetical protein
MSNCATCGNHQPARSVTRHSENRCAQSVNGRPTLPWADHTDLRNRVHSMPMLSTYHLGTNNHTVISRQCLPWMYHRQSTVLMKQANNPVNISDLTQRGYLGISHLRYGAIRLIVSASRHAD